MSTCVQSFCLSFFPGLSGFPTLGGDDITLTGTSFGPVDATNEVAAYYSNPALSTVRTQYDAFIWSQGFIPPEDPGQGV